MANFYCKWCGVKYASIGNLTSGACPRNPEGNKHALYEGNEKSQYTCKYCGTKKPSFMALVRELYTKSPTKKHQAL